MNEWNSRVLELLLRMFPSDRQPRLLHPYIDPQFNSRNIVCDRILVPLSSPPHPQTFLRNWEPAGSGSFLGTLLAADWLRAAAYTYMNFYPPHYRNEKLQLTIVRRPTFRLVLNHDKLIKRINQMLLDYVGKRRRCYP